jgi:hypothetical protein
MSQSDAPDDSENQHRAGMRHRRAIVTPCDVLQSAETELADMRTLTRLVLLTALVPICFRELDAGEVITIAGNGSLEQDADAVDALSASVGGPFGVVIGPDGGLYICEISDHEISRVDMTDGSISRVVGDGTMGNSGDGAAATEAEINEPYEVRFDGTGVVSPCCVADSPTPFGAAAYRSPSSTARLTA